MSLQQFLRLNPTETKKVEAEDIDMTPEEDKKEVITEAVLEEGIIIQITRIIFR